MTELGAILHVIEEEELLKSNNRKENKSEARYIMHCVDNESDGLFLFCLPYAV